MNICNIVLAVLCADCTREQDREIHGQPHQDREACENTKDKYEFNK